MHGKRWLKARKSRRHIIYCIDIDLSTLSHHAIFVTRSSGQSVPLLLAPAEGWGPFRPLGALRALLGALAPSRVAISKLWTLNFEKLEICATFITILRYVKAKFDYSYIIIFCFMVLRIYTKKFRSFQAKIKPRRWFSRFKIKSKVPNIFVF